ncbi:hypothetical protein GDO86_001766, partial [Hymenochirus boettgeri]
HSGKVDLGFSSLIRKKRQNEDATQDSLQEDNSTAFTHASEAGTVLITTESMFTEDFTAVTPHVTNNTIRDISDVNVVTADQDLAQTNHQETMTKTAKTSYMFKTSASPNAKSDTPKSFTETTTFNHHHTTDFNSTSHPKRDADHVTDHETSTPHSSVNEYESTMTSTYKSNEMINTTVHKTDHPLSSSEKVEVTSTEHTPPAHFMRQCMLVILILAVVCTIFIITTVALAAKLSRDRNRYKLRQTNFTEMTCITSLLPESDQQSKVKPKIMKTFAANMEDSDGDNTTLNSFLPDH